MRKRGWRRQRGQALTELALLSVVLIIILLGAIDLARVFQFDTAVQEAAREGVRHGAWFDTSGGNKYMDDNDIRSAVCTPLKGSGMMPSISDCSPAALVGSTVLTVSAVCPASSGGNPSGSTVAVYTCYDGKTSPPSAATCATSGAKGGFDMEVAVRANFALIIPTGLVGLAPTFPISGDAHMRAQGC